MLCFTLIVCFCGSEIEGRLFLENKLISIVVRGRLVWFFCLMCLFVTSSQIVNVCLGAFVTVCVFVSVHAMWETFGH